MLYIPTNEKINLEWSVKKGVGNEAEDFSRATVSLFLFSDENRWTVPCTADYAGVVRAEIPETLPEGVYGLDLIWIKNGQQLEGLRSLQRTRKTHVFAIDAATSPAAGGQPITLKMSTVASSFGYDGLSAYEIAVLRGTATKDEYSWSKGLFNDVLANELDKNQKELRQNQLELGEAKIGLYQQSKDIDALQDPIKPLTTNTDGKMELQYGKGLYVENGKLCAKEYVLPEGSIPVYSEGKGVNISEDKTISVATDEEDISVNENDKLSLKDRSNTDGMGYVILRKNKSFQEQVKHPNTIYEVRYDFDLGKKSYSVTLDTLVTVAGTAYVVDEKYITLAPGDTLTVPNGYAIVNSASSGTLASPYTATESTNVYVGVPQSTHPLGSTCEYSIEQIVKMPENCVLKFEGGSLRNGTLTGDRTNITVAQRLILRNIRIRGNFINQWDLSWFADNKQDISVVLNNLISDLALSDNKRVIYIPKGEWIIDNQIELCAGLEIYGDGDQDYYEDIWTGERGNKTIIRSNVKDAPTFGIIFKDKGTGKVATIQQRFSKGMENAVEGTRIAAIGTKIHDLTLYSDTYATLAIEVSGCYSAVYNIVVKGFKYGLLAYNTWNSEIKNMTLRCRVHGMMIGNVSTELLVKDVQCFKSGTEDIVEGDSLMYATQYSPEGVEATKNMSIGIVTTAAYVIFMNCTSEKWDVGTVSYYGSATFHNLYVEHLVYYGVVCKGSSTRVTIHGMTGAEAAPTYYQYVSWTSGRIRVCGTATYGKCVIENNPTDGTCNRLEDFITFEDSVARTETGAFKELPYDKKIKNLIEDYVFIKNSEEPTNSGRTTALAITIPTFVARQRTQIRNDQMPYDYKKVKYLYVLEDVTIENISMYSTELYIIGKNTPTVTIGSNVVMQGVKLTFVEVKIKFDQPVSLGAKGKTSNDIYFENCEFEILSSAFSVSASASSTTIAFWKAVGISAKDADKVVATTLINADINILFNGVKVIRPYYDSSETLPDNYANQVGKHSFHRNMIVATKKGWMDYDGFPHSARRGNSGSRPQTLTSVDYGFVFFDSTLSKPIWWAGTKWVDATGAEV